MAEARGEAARRRECDGPRLSVVDVDVVDRPAAPTGRDGGILRVNPHDLRVPEPWVEDREFADLVRSIARYGVLVPITCARDNEDCLEVVSGRRRVKAAREVAADVPVLVASGAVDGAETLTRVFNEDIHRLSKRSTIERGLQLRDLMKALELEGKSTSVRALAARLGVSVGTVHTWRSVAVRFTVEDMAILAEQAGVTLDDVLSLSVRRAKALVAASTYWERLDVVRGKGPEGEKAAPASPAGNAVHSAPARWRRRFAETAQRLSRYVVDVRLWLRKLGSLLGRVVLAGRASERLPSWRLKRGATLEDAGTHRGS